MRTPIHDNQLLIVSSSCCKDGANDEMVPAKTVSKLIEEKKSAPSMSSLSDSPSEEVLDDASQEPSIGELEK